MKRLFGARAAAACVTVTVAVVAALAGFGAFGAHGAVPRTGPLSIRAGLKGPPGAFVRADGLFDGRGGKAKLGEAVSGAMTGPLSPVAVRSADGALVAYNTWRELRGVDHDRSFSKQGIAEGEVLGTPSLRVHDVTGHDFVLARGAYSAAWRDDGAIAFVKGVDPDFRADRPYAGQVIVRDTVHGRDTAWTTEAAHYMVYAWAAGDRLLFYRVGLGEKLELMVADGPGKVRPLADGSAIALSPDGTSVAVVSQDATNVRVLDVATGGELSWIDVTTSTPALRWVAYSGSWVGDHLVAPANAGLAVFHVGSRSLELEQVLGLDRAQLPVGVQEPRFVDEAGNVIAATAEVPPDGSSAAVSFQLECDRIARTCERGDAAPASDWLRPVTEEGGR